MGPMCHLQAVLLKQLGKQDLLKRSLFLWVDDLILCGRSGEETLDLLDKVICTRFSCHLTFFSELA